MSNYITDIALSIRRRRVCLFFQTVVTRGSVKSPSVTLCQKQTPDDRRDAHRRVLRLRRKLLNYGLSRSVIYTTACTRHKIRTYRRSRN